MTRQLSVAMTVALLTACLLIVSGSASAATEAPEVKFGPSGAITLRYGGVTLLNEQPLLPLEFNQIDAAGHMTHVWIHAGDYTSKWDPTKHLLTWTFGWGTVDTTFTQSKAQLDLASTIHNTSVDTTFAGIVITAYVVQFPAIPKGLSASPAISFGTGEPAVVCADFGSGAMAVVNTDASPLYSGFYSTNFTATQFNYMLWCGGTPHASDVPFWPKFYRKVSPGKSDTYRISLRFGPGGSTAQTLAPDAFANFARKTPFTLKWSDRRPIGYLLPAGSAPATRSASNPNGWFNDPRVDVQSDAGRAAFAARLMSYADRSVAVLKRLNAQGVIVWDLEGEGTPAYVGDPRLAEKLAPELSYGGLLDAFFKKFSDSGLRTGVTIRPTQLSGVGPTAVQEEVADPAALLIAKIGYAKSRWGCTLFYIDSYVAGLTVNGVNVMQTVARAQPDVLLIPEHGAAADFASSAVYLELRNGAALVPALVPQTYPHAFGCINVSGSAPGIVMNAKIAAAVKAGNIPLCHGWADEPMNQFIAAMYPRTKAN